MFIKYLKKKTLFIVSVIGNTLDHYDSALYVFLAPFLAPLFFPKSDPTVALILVYGLKSTSIITRPLGAIFFGHLATKYPVKNILALTLAGVSICTFGIGLIPAYSKIGVLAPILLCIIKGLQGIFASGEHSIASLFFIEQISDNKQHGKASSYYFGSTMVGTMLASIAAMCVSKSSNPEFYWRIAFIAGVATGIMGLIIRLIKYTPPKNQIVINKLNIRKSFAYLTANSKKVLKITIISSFSFLTYTLPFVFLNNFIPLITEIKFESLLTHNTILLVVDIAMIPVFGILADKFNFSHIMAWAAFLLTITIIPIFYFLPELTLMQITLVKLWIIILGVAFLAPFNAYLFRMINGKEKYMISGFSYSLGTEILGRNIPAICLFLWSYTANTLAPAIYLCLICLVTTLILINDIRNQATIIQEGNI